MYDIVNLKKSMDTLEKQDTYSGYSKVVLVVSDEIGYEVGTDSGRTLTLDCPWGTQRMAEDILSRIRGFQYQPYTMTGAHLDPAAELGDGVSAANLYSGIFTKKVSHDPLYTADMSAPGGEKINYKYPYKSVTERKIERQYAETKASFQVQAAQIAAEVSAREVLGTELRASLNIQAGLISSKVSKSGGDDSSFAWEHDDNKIIYKANGSEVFRIDASGAKVTGEIRATSGKIGGFDIQADYLSYNGQTWGGTNSTGAYLGTSGLQLGKNFKVDMSGNLTAATGTFSGYTNAGNIQYGGSYGTLSGSGLTSGSVYGTQIAGATLSTAKFTSGVNTSLGYADYAYGCLQGWTKITALTTGSLNTNDLTVENHQIDRKTIYYTNSSGGTSSVKVLVWT